MFRRWSNQKGPAVALLWAFASVVWISGAFSQTRPSLALDRPEPPKSPEVVVQFQSGNYPVNIPRVLRAVASRNRLSTTKVEILKRGETVCGIYSGLLPGGCTEETKKLARALNVVNPLRLQALSVGQSIVIPEIALVERPHIVKLDPRVGSDRERIDDLKASWAQKESREEQLPDGYVAFSFKGYELSIPTYTDEDAKELRDHLRSLQLPNVSVSARYRNAPDIPLHSLASPTKFWKDCIANQGRLPQKVEGDLRMSLARSRPRSCTVSCKDEQCPDVVLVDTVVFPHPEISPFVDVDPTTCKVFPTAPTVTEQSCRTDLFDKRLHHGTHLAGIVSAAQDDNGMAGVAPGTRITNVCWPTDAATLGEFMDMRGQAGGQPPIYLFASKFLPDSTPTPTQENDRLNVHRNPLGTTVWRRRDLWIVAAGNGEGDRYVEISRISNDTPANLGDQENVVVVTACQDCYSDPKLLPSANRAARDQPLVHIAAPGLQIPSICTTRDYALASGTSQAAALVAGVVAAMKACYPTAYTEPHVVKTRLQTTSSPFPTSLDDPPRDLGLAAGIVDIDAALLDPKHDWIKTNGGDWRQVRVRRWNGQFEISNRVLRMKDIYRLTRMDTPDKYVAFSRFPFDIHSQRRGEVLRVGPDRLKRTTKGSNDPNVILELCDEEPVTLAELDDVLLSKPLLGESATKSCK